MSTLRLHVAQMPCTCFFIGDHWNETVLGILTIHVSMVSKSYLPYVSYQTKFQLNLTYGLRDVHTGCHFAHQNEGESASAC